MRSAWQHDERGGSLGRLPAALYASSGSVELASAPTGRTSRPRLPEGQATGKCIPFSPSFSDSVRRQISGPARPRAKVLELVALDEHRQTEQFRGMRLDALSARCLLVSPGGGEERRSVEHQTKASRNAAQLKRWKARWAQARHRPGASPRSAGLVCGGDVMDGIDRKPRRRRTPTCCRPSRPSRRP